MHTMTRRLLMALLACTACMALAAGMATAEDNYNSITMRVPMKLKKMLPEAKWASVWCEIRDDDGNLLSKRNKNAGLGDGDLDYVAELAFTPMPGKTFFKATSYQCLLALHTADVDNSKIYPLVGTPPRADLYRWARPDEYFLQMVKGRLDGGTVNPGIAGPKDLTIQPKTKD